MESNVVNEDLIRFKEKNALKVSSDVKLQTISDDNTITFRGVEYSLEGLEPYSILSPHFEQNPNDNTTSHTASPLWRKVIDDTVILVVMDANRISSISIRNKKERGDILYVEANETSTEPHYATVTNVDYDEEQLKVSKSARSYDDWMKDNDKETSQVSSKAIARARSPKTADCASRTTSVIEVAIAHDASFCKEFDGNKQRVNSHIQAIVALAAEYYEPACISLRLSYIDGTCNPSNDPYKSIAKSKQILEEFTAEWRKTKEGIRRDVAHLFSGTPFDRGILGWAWKNTVCSKKNGYGANWLNFSENIALRASLFAHELGHNAGANHFGSSCSEWLMAPCGSGLKGFSKQSLDSVTSFLDKQACLERRPTEIRPQFINPNRPTPQAPPFRPPIHNPPPHRPIYPVPVLPPSVNTSNNHRPPFLNPQTSPIFAPTTNKPPFHTTIFSPTSVITNNNNNNNRPPFLNPQPNGPPFLAPTITTINSPPFLAPTSTTPSVNTSNNNRPPFLVPEPSPNFSSPTSPSGSPLGIRSPDRYFEIRNVAVESFCLELEGDWRRENIKVTMQVCNGSETQKWGFNAKSKTIHSFKLENRCMVPDLGNKSTKRTRLTMQDCPDNIEETQSRPSLLPFQWSFTNGNIRNKGTTSASYLEASRGVRRDGDLEEVVLVPTLSISNGKDYQKWIRSFD